jgi:hypothetical protein
MRSRVLRSSSGTGKGSDEERKLLRKEGKEIRI